MNTNKLKSNEIIGKRQLFNLKGGTNSSTNTNPSSNNGGISNINTVEGGDETDKRAKRPGVI
jgi:hypothetical protein